MYDKFIKNGVFIESELEKLKNDISVLLLPSIERANQLNKAYKVIVNEQSYIYGRDPHVEPVTNIHKTISLGESTGVREAILAGGL